MTRLRNRRAPPRLRPPEVSSGFASEILEDLAATRAGTADATTAARLAARTPHVLTANFKGKTSLDIAGRSNPLRFIYSEHSWGIDWDVVNTKAH
jgi:hypothetical protein